MRRAHDLVRAGQGVVDLGAEQLRQAEVGDLHAAAFVEQDVFRLDVAMDHAFIVGELQGVADLRDDFERLGRLEIARSQCLPQIDAVDVFHQKVIKAAALAMRLMGARPGRQGVAKIENGDDVGMTQLGEAPRLAREAFRESRIAADVGRQDFKGDQAV